MSEREMNAIASMSTSVNALIDAGYENTVAAVIASFNAGKEAGKREASKEAEAQINQ